MPYWRNLWNQGHIAQSLTTNNPFMGDARAGPTDYGYRGLDTMEGILPFLGEGAPELMNFAQSTLRGDYLHPDSNPFLRATADAAVGRAREGLLNQALPAISDQAIAQGAYGGARQDLSQERATQDFGRSALDAVTALYGNNYAQERNRQFQAPALIGQAQQMAAQPAQALMGMNEILQGFNQIPLDNARARYDSQMQAPWYGLGEMANLLSAGGYGNTTGQGTGTKVAPNPNYEDPFTQYLKMGLGALGAGAAIGGKGGFNLWK